MKAKAAGIAVGKLFIWPTMPPLAHQRQDEDGFATCHRNQILFLFVCMKTAAICALLLFLCCHAFADEWETISSCRLIDNAANDGDSFHVNADGEERIFRLYFVDTPEAESGGYVEGRVAEQAEEFGITEEESVEMGKKAAAFTRAVLSRPFKVTTRGQNAMGASALKREYAFVETADGEDLGEMLVGRGLARSFGEDAAAMGKSATSLRSKYDRLEAKARSGRLGAWGDGAATPTIALPSGTKDSEETRLQPVVTPLRNVVRSDEVTAEATSDALEKTSEAIFAFSQSPKANDEPKQSGKVSLNNATLAELEALPEVGPKTAQAIIDGRPYAKIEDVDRINGVGPKTIEAILPLITK
jgi:competence ComEA-like helix-hairpin-helix protein